MIDIVQLNQRIKRMPGYCMVPAAADHIDFMQTDDPGLLAAQEYVSIKNRVAYQISIGDAITVLKHGSPIGMFGVIVLWEGAAEAWAIFSPDIRKTPKQFSVGARVFCDIAAQSLGLRRMQITVRCSDERAVRWAQFLGFEIEGRMRRYSADGADAYMMARV